MHDQINFEDQVKKFIVKPFEYGQLSDTELREYEKKLGVPLPEDYRKFLLLTNGGRSIDHFVWTRYTSGMWEKIIPEAFLGLNASDNWLPLPDALDFSGDNSPPGYLRIACDPGGNYLYMNLNKDDDLRPFGALYFLDHEDMPEKSNLRYVAPSFNSYLTLAEIYYPDQELDIAGQLGQILRSENLQALDTFFSNHPTLRLNEYYGYGNTLADQALVEGKKKLFKKLVDMGAKSPRFFMYAHKILSEDEIVEYIRSGKL